MMWTKATINGQRQVVKGLVNPRRAEVDLFTKLNLQNKKTALIQAINKYRGI